MKALSTACSAAAIALLCSQALADGKVGVSSIGPNTMSLSSISFTGNIVGTTPETQTFSRNVSIASGATASFTSQNYSDPRVAETVWDIPGKGGAPSRTVVLKGGEDPTTLPIVYLGGEDPTTLPYVQEEVAVVASAAHDLEYSMTPSEAAAVLPLALFDTISVTNGVDTTGTYPVSVIFTNATTGLPANGTLICRGIISTTVTWSDTSVDGKPGTGGLVPELDGSGVLAANQTVTLTLSDAAASASTFLVIGFSEVNLPVPEGIFVPAPDVLLSGIVTDANGEVTTPFTLGPAFPSGIELYLQQWITDPGAAQGVSHTNGLRGISP